MLLYILSFLLGYNIREQQLKCQLPTGKELHILKWALLSFLLRFEIEEIELRRFYPSQETKGIMLRQACHNICQKYDNSYILAIKNFAINKLPKGVLHGKYLQNWAADQRSLTCLIMIPEFFKTRLLIHFKTFQTCWF